jgi:hypothetical protein
VIAVVVIAASVAFASAKAPRPAAPAPPPPAPWLAPVDVDVDARVRAPWRGGLNERLVDVSDAFVGAPYVVSPLGEGEGKDADPRLRFDAFDCTTFVETTLALALAHDLDDARAILDRIRYRGAVVAFDERRHFPESEWIPGLVAAGLLQDVTRAVGGAPCAQERGTPAPCPAPTDDVRLEKKVLDAAVWKRARGKNLPDLPPERVPSGTFALDVWRLPAAAAHPERIPLGTVLHVVRVDFKNVPVRVSHQGIVIEKDGKRFLRHAADRSHHHVVDEPLDRFFARVQRYARWPVAGVHLTQIVPAPDWRARLGLPALPTPSSTPSSSSPSVPLPDPPTASSPPALPPSTTP